MQVSHRQRKNKEENRVAIKKRKQSRSNNEKKGINKNM